MVNVEVVLAARRGLVEAPAGCGKTQLIVETLTNPSDTPTLVLTHTSAGVAALRNRLASRNVPNTHYKLATIDSWAMNIITRFPARAGYTVDPNQLNYVAMRGAATRLCGGGHINTIINSNYGRLLVDEYQDCSTSQHDLVKALSNVLPTVVFGDPMQAIFNFGRDLPPNWQAEISTFFPHLGTLNIPWRWNNARAGELGQWLLGVRLALMSGQVIDLRTCPNYVEWLQPGNNPSDNIQAQIRAQYQATRGCPNDKVLIIGDSINPDSRHAYASRVNGVNVVETVELKDTLLHIDAMDGTRGSELLVAVIDFLRKVMINVYGDQLLTRIDSIENGRNRTEPTPQEQAALSLNDNGGYHEAIEFIKGMQLDTNRRVYRHTPFNMVLNALQHALLDETQSLKDIFISMREQRRHAGRAVSGKAVGSTLLLKGLEADHVIVLDADNPDRNKRMNAQHLYVALTRGAKSVKIFSRSPILPA